MAIQTLYWYWQFWGFSGPLKSFESLLQCMQQKVNNSVSVTAAADCIAPTWPGSH